MRIIHKLKDRIVLGENSFPETLFYMNDSNEKVYEEKVDDLRQFNITDPSKLLFEANVTESFKTYSLIEKSDQLKKEINEETYNSLTKDFQKKYKLNTEKVCKTFNVVDYFKDNTYFNIVEYDLTYDQLLANRTSNPGGFFVDAATKGSLSFSKVGIKASQINQYLVSLANKYPVSHAVVTSYRIDFTDKPYNGELKKIRSKKRDGQYYADGRGTMTRDYKAIDSLDISISTSWSERRALFASTNVDEVEKKALKVLNKMRFSY